MSETIYPDYGRRTDAGGAARECRQRLEADGLGRPRTPAEEADYWEAAAEELRLESPWLAAELRHARARAEAARARLAAG